MVDGMPAGTAASVHSTVYMGSALVRAASSWLRVTGRPATAPTDRTRRPSVSVAVMLVLWGPSVGVSVTRSVSAAVGRSRTPDQVNGRTTSSPVSVSAAWKAASIVAGWTVNPGSATGESSA